MKPAKAYDCETCKDSGTVARFTSNGNYKCAGPVPEDARRCFEAFCDCPQGASLQREEHR